MSDSPSYTDGTHVCEHCGRDFDSYQAAAVYKYRCPDCSYSIIIRKVIDDNPTHAHFPEVSRGTTQSQLNAMHAVAESCGGFVGYDHPELNELIKPRSLKLDTPVESSDPDHYKTSTIECIDAMRAMLGDEGFKAYLRGTIFKYNWRLGRKDDPKVETEKMYTYLGWLGDVIAGKELSK